MQPVKVSTLTIKLDGGNNLKIKQKLYRVILHKLSEKYTKLLKKNKIKELTNAGNEN